LPGATAGDDVVARARAVARPAWAALVDELRGIRDTSVQAALLTTVWSR
jgi:hypothetical protein